MNHLKRLLLHPFFLALYPVLALYAANITQTQPREIYRAAVVNLLLAGGLLVMLRLLRIRPARAAGVVSVTILLFFSFGQVYTVIPRTTLAGAIFGQMDVLAACWAAAWILTGWFILRKLKALEPFTLIFNVASAALLLGQLVIISSAVIRGGLPRSVEFPMPPQVSAADQTATISRPDIYYIILDGYPREDVLRELFQYDNSQLIDHLRSRGFFIANRSTSNYGQTAVSLASSLNFEHLQAVAEQVGSGSNNYDPLSRLIRNNRARRFLEARGYTFVALETGYSVTEIPDAGRYIRFGFPVNAFETLLLQNSLAVIGLDSTFAARYRDRINGAFHELAALPAYESPKFVFAHIMAAHRPFVFGPNGEVVDVQSYRVADGQALPADFSTDDAMRVDQITYINQLVMQTVDAILAESTVPPVIIIQADHGSDRYMDWQSAAHTCFTERMAIFNAYYFPDHQTQLLYDSITPVNTFRAVFNTYFGADLPFLEDRNYYSIWAAPYDFTDITGQQGVCPD